MTTSLTSGLPRRETWTQPPPALGRRPHPDHCVVSVRPRDGLAVARDQPLRDLHDDGGDVGSAQVVLALSLVAGELSEVDAVEGGAEIDEERVLALTCEHLRAARERPHGPVRELLIVRERLGADVRRRRWGAASQYALARRFAAAAVAVPLLHARVALDDVQLRIAVPARSRKGVQERVLVPDRRLELVPVADVRTAVPGVVDVDVVPGPVVPAEEVRAVGRNLSRDPVRRDRERTRCVLRRPRIRVGVVRRRVERDARRLAVARAEPERDRYGRRGKRRDGEWELPHGRVLLWTAMKRAP